MEYRDFKFKVIEQNRTVSFRVVWAHSVAEAFENLSAYYSADHILGLA